MDQVECIGGFKTLSLGHVDVWPELQRAHSKLRGHGYEFFPRGRVNWREVDDTLILLADEAILRDRLHELVLSRWNLKGRRCEILRDPHYRVNKLA